MDGTLVVFKISYIDLIFKTYMKKIFFAFLQGPQESAMPGVPKKDSCL